METGTSILHAIAALLLVLGMISLVAWLFKRFAFGGNLLTRLPSREGRTLQVVESLWLDARYRVVIVKEGDAKHTLLLGPQEALQLGAKPTGLPHA